MRAMPFALASLFALALVAGCSTERRTVTRETEVVKPEPPRIIERQTTIESAPPETEERTIIRRRHTDTLQEDDDE